MKTCIQLVTSRTLLFIIFLFPALQPAAASPADSLFDVSTIPVHLLEDADAVIRYHEIDLRVTDRRRAHQTVRLVVTILNPQGRTHGDMQVPYDEFRTIRSFSGELYDANGKRIKRIRRGDIQDYSMISGYTLYQENRIQRAELYHNTYPYTVYFEYEIRYNGYINWPEWNIEWRRTAVENTVFNVSIPPDRELRYRNIRYDGEPDITRERNHKIYRWSESNVPAFTEEPYGPHFREQIMKVEIAPGDFEIQGKRGEFSSWQAFGKWYFMLSEGRNALPDAAMRDVRRIAGESECKHEIAGKLFEYMQSRTRYVNISLGIGGWQPFDATFVHERGYGDCKALSNYMMALLDAAGIESYPVLIYSGSRPRNLIDDFAINQFNHVILKVIIDGDAIWLECTSQTIPFGHIGRNNENRKALLITPDGGQIIHTPVSTADDNRQYRSAVVQLRVNGSIVAGVEELFTGIQQDRIRGGLANKSSRDRLDWMKRHVDLPSFNLATVDYSGVESRTPEAKLRYEIDVPGYANRMGNRLMFQANILERRTNVPSPSENRLHDIYFPYAYLDVDSITYILPDDFIIEAKPEPVEIDSGFAVYRAYIDDSVPGRIIYYREIEIKQNTIPGSLYNEFRNFFLDVVRADRMQIVARKS